MLHTCPVRELDPEADFYIDWMVETHRVGSAGWQPWRLPHRGPIAAQDARLMQGMRVAQGEANALLSEDQAARRAGSAHDRDLD